MPDLSNFFQPKSIAVIGASEREGSMGAVVMQNLRQSEYPHPLYAVNIKGYASVFGYPAFRYVREIRDPVDLAVICLPPESLMRVLRQLGRVGIRKKQEKKTKTTKSKRLGT